MNRRLFILSGLSSLPLLTLWPRPSQAYSSFDEMASLTASFTDNDEGEVHPSHDGGLFRLEPTAGKLQFFTFEQLLPFLTPFVESQFDLFIFVNTERQGSSREFVPYQQVRVIRRSQPGSPLFARDSGNRVTGLSREAEDLGLIPTSTGIPGDGGILTYSGVFRFNEKKSRSRMGTNESIHAAMSYSMYIDYVYSSGRESGIALHGTPAANHHLLGRSRASHGCIRVVPGVARQLREMLFHPAMRSETLPDFDRRSQLPSLDAIQGKAGVRPGVKALFFIFNGYSNPAIDT